MSALVRLRIGSRETLCVALLCALVLAGRAKPRAGLSPLSPELRTQPAASDSGASPFTLGFAATAVRAPVKEVLAPEPGWVQTFAVTPGQQVAEGEVLLRLWKEPPVGEATLPQEVTDALARLEAAEAAEREAREKRRLAGERLARLQKDIEAARAQLESARALLHATSAEARARSVAATQLQALQTARMRAWREQLTTAEKAAEEATRAATKAAQAETEAQAKLPAARKKVAAAKETQTKQERLFDLGVVAATVVDEARQSVARAEAELKVLETDCEQAAKRHAEADERERAAKRALTALPPKPESKPVEPDTVDLTGPTEAVTIAQSEVKSLSERLTSRLAEIESLDQAAEGAKTARKRAEQAWKEAQLRTIAPDPDALIEITAPEPLVAGDWMAAERTKVVAAASLLAYRPGTGWEIALELDAATAQTLRLVSLARVKLLVEPFQVFDCRIYARDHGPGDRVRFRLTVPQSVTPTLAQGAPALVRFVKTPNAEKSAAPRSAAPTEASLAE